MNKNVNNDFCLVAWIWINLSPYSCCSNNGLFCSNLTFSVKIWVILNNYVYNYCLRRGIFCQQSSRIGDDIGCWVDLLSSLLSTMMKLDSVIKLEKILGWADRNRKPHLAGPSLERMPHMPRHTLNLDNVCQAYVLKRHQSQKETVFLMFVPKMRLQTNLYLKMKVEDQILV